MLILSIMTVFVTFEICNHETNYTLSFLLMHFRPNDQGRARSRSYPGPIDVGLQKGEGAGL